MVIIVYLDTVEKIIHLPRTLNEININEIKQLFMNSNYALLKFKQQPSNMCNLCSAGETWVRGHRYSPVTESDAWSQHLVCEISLLPSSLPSPTPREHKTVLMRNKVRIHGVARIVQTRRFDKLRLISRRIKSSGSCLGHAVQTEVGTRHGSSD